MSTAGQGKLILPYFLLLKHSEILKLKLLRQVDISVDHSQGSFWPKKLETALRLITLSGQWLDSPASYLLATVGSGYMHWCLHNADTRQGFPGIMSAILQRFHVYLIFPLASCGPEGNSRKLFTILNQKSFCIIK